MSAVSGILLKGSNIFHNSKDAYLYFFLSFIFFFPTKYFSIYHVFFLLLVSLFPFLYGFTLKNKKSLLLFFAFVFLIFASSVLSAIYYNVSVVRNLSEVFRFLPVFFIAFSFCKNRENVLNIFSKFILFYSFIVLIVSCLQFYKFSIVDSVTDLYGAANHIELSLGISSRTLGLSSGPGQNGAIMAVLYAISLAQLIVSQSKRKWFLVSLFSLLSVFLSQSQTSFVVVGGVTFYACLLGVIRHDLFSLKIFLKIFSGFFLLSIIVYFIMKDSLKYLFNLFSQGLERNAFQARLSKSEGIFDSILENPFFLVFGHGKDFFGNVSTSMDNELLFYLAVYGVFASVIIFSFYLAILVQPFFRGRKHLVENPYFLSLNFIIVVGVVMAYPSAFILDPRILFIVVFFYALSKQSSFLMLSTRSSCA